MVCSAGTSDGVHEEEAGAPRGNRTPVSTLKGWRPGPLDDGGTGVSIGALYSARQRVRRGRGPACRQAGGARQELAAGRRGVYAMFNNASMLEDTLRFQALLAGE